LRSFRSLGMTAAEQLPLSPGFEEVIYQRALALELPAHNLEFSREVWMGHR
jgi:hypothetical protein